MSWPPPEIVERLRALDAGEIAPAGTRDAATVVLLRNAVTPRADGSRLEVFVLRRVSTMAFGAGMHVFPGGKVDDADDCGADLPQEWADLLAGGDPQRLRRLVGAAIRETAEEAGVVLEPLQLKPFAHWITPEVEVRRYDTRFFVAAIPHGQRACCSDGEADLGTWVSPQDGLALALMPPTTVALQNLAESPDVAAAVGRPRAISLVAPVFIREGDSYRFSLGGR